MKINELGQKLHTARLEGSPIVQISSELKLSRSEAYEIQERGIDHRLKAGEKWVGFKMGLTSEAKRRQMNLDSSLYGELTDKMQVKDGASFSLSGLIHSKIEPEIAFLISKPLKGKVTHQDVMEACGGVYACLEILDSRYEQFKYFSMEDVIADNSSSSHFILGPIEENFRELDFKNLQMGMYVNDELAHEGISSAISGDPVNSVIELAALLHERARSIPAGAIVLAGAATPAVALEPGMRVKLEVGQLGSLTVAIEE